MVVVVIVRCTSTSKRGERASAALEMGSAFPMPASPVGAWKGKERETKSGDWTSAYTDEGHLYYHNTATGESSWEPPLV